MPMSSSQLAALVDRARHKAVTSPPPPPSPAAQRPVRSRQAAPVSQVPSTARIEPRTGPLQPNDAVEPPAPSPPPSLAPSPQSEHAAEAFPIGWVLGKDSWRFHRRFYAVFKRPMECGEYGCLLKQIRFGQAEHLGEDCWRVTLPGNSRTLPVRATQWRLITILPKDWQPPTPVEVPAAIETSRRDPEAKWRVRPDRCRLRSS
jgi:hypothetical protein